MKLTAWKCALEPEALADLGRRLDNAIDNGYSDRELEDESSRRKARGGGRGSPGALGPCGRSRPEVLTYASSV
eukprot:1905122-Lingulodinium_polyedra.AAC.1